MSIHIHKAKYREWLMAIAKDHNANVDNIIKLVKRAIHAPSCNEHYLVCPEACGCSVNRKYPLDLVTSILWSLTSSVRVQLRVYDRIEADLPESQVLTIVEKWIKDADAWEDKWESVFHIIEAHHSQFAYAREIFDVLLECKENFRFFLTDFLRGYPYGRAGSVDEVREIFALHHDNYFSSYDLRTEIYRRTTRDKKATPRAIAHLKKREADRTKAIEKPAMLIANKWSYTAANILWIADVFAMFSEQIDKYIHHDRCGSHPHQCPEMCSCASGRRRQERTPLNMVTAILWQVSSELMEIQSDLKDLHPEFDKPKPEVAKEFVVTLRERSKRANDTATEMVRVYTWIECLLGQHHSHVTATLRRFLTRLIHMLESYTEIVAKPHTKTNIGRLMNIFTYFANGALYEMNLYMMQLEYAQDGQK